MPEVGIGRPLSGLVPALKMESTMVDILKWENIRDYRRKSNHQYILHPTNRRSRWTQGMGMVRENSVLDAW